MTTSDLTKVLFLDIDGVVNCHKTIQRHNGYIGIDPYMALMVDRIKQATNCTVVISSSWRTFPDGLKEIKNKVVDYDDVTKVLDDIRGAEVKEWLDKHPEVIKYAILDDNMDFYPDQYLFKTRFYEDGLTEEIANKVIKHLNKNETKNNI